MTAQTDHGGPAAGTDARSAAERRARMRQATRQRAIAAAEEIRKRRQQQNFYPVVLIGQRPAGAPNLLGFVRARTALAPLVGKVWRRC